MLRAVVVVTVGPVRAEVCTSTAVGRPLSICDSSVEPGWMGLLTGYCLVVPTEPEIQPRPIDPDAGVGVAVQKVENIW